MVTNIDNRQSAAKAGLRGKLPRVRGSGPKERGQTKVKVAKKRILRPDYTNKMFVDTTEPHKLLGDTVKKSYEMSDTSIIAAVVAECERMRSAASAHCTADSILTRHHITSSSVEWKCCSSVSCQPSHTQDLGHGTTGTPPLHDQNMDEFQQVVSSYTCLFCISL